MRKDKPVDELDALQKLIVLSHQSIFVFSLMIALIFCTLF
jgi:hypothetical protein